jgi:acetyl-CoA carboxylase biotin carboxyl carrier protein
MTAAEDQDGQYATMLAAVASLAQGLPGAVRRISLRADGHEVEVEWQPAPAAGGTTAPPGPPGGDEHAGPAREQATAAEGIAVTAPLVGTFYMAPEPGAAPFIEVGDAVKPGQALAIIEAMKLMNTIVAEHPGVVTQVCVGNGEPVEFGQLLFRLVPAHAAPANGSPEA